MPPRPLTLALLALLCCSACTPVRTVYDSMGNEVNEEENGGEKDLMSTFEKRFDAAFSEQKTADGVPQTTSSKVSSFQRDLEDARRMDKSFSTGSFDTGKQLDLRESGFAGAGKRYASGKDGIEKTVNSLYSTDLRPDFMNESHGISHSTRYTGADASNRSSLEGLSTGARSQSFYLAGETPYNTSQQGSSYVEHRRDKTQQPTIINYQDYYRQHRNSVRQLLGRDNDPAQSGQ